MNVSQVKETARQWVIEGVSKLPDFWGAYLAGSITHLPDNIDFSTSSDVDIAFALTQPNPENKPAKFLYRNVLIEVNYPLWSDNFLVSGAPHCPGTLIVTQDKQNVGRVEIATGHNLPPEQNGSRSEETTMRSFVSPAYFLTFRRRKPGRH